MNDLRNLSQFRNNLIYFALTILTLLLALEIPWLWLLVVLYQVFLWKKSQNLSKLALAVGLVFMLRYAFVFTPDLDTKTTHQVKITEVKQYEDYAVLKGKIAYFSVQLHYQGPHLFSLGEVYQMSLEEVKDKEASIPFTFDANRYLKGQNIKGVYQVISFEYSKKEKHINQVIQALDDGIKERCPKSYSYIKTMVLADKDAMDEEVMEDIQFLGISHLFAVSGLHIALLALMFKKLLSLLISKEIMVDLSLVLFLVLYMILTSFSPSVVRASLMVSLLVASKYRKWDLSALDVLSIIFIFLLFIHPFFYLQVGFQLSFLMTVFLLLARDLLRDVDKLKGAVLVSVLAFFSSLPFTLAFNQSVNLLTIFYNVMYLFFVMFAFLPFAYITLLFPVLDELYYGLIEVFETSIAFFSSFDLFVLDFVINHWIYFLIYYLLWIRLLIAMEEKHSLKGPRLVFVLFFFFLLVQEKFVWYSSVHFVDVYGDASLIQSSFDRCNILIDTGGKDDYDGLITYMKNRHIKRLDYLIVSHDHDDHNGELEDILDNFEVKNYINGDNIGFYHGLTTCGEADFFFYETTKNHANENNNSLVMSLYFKGDHYLFTGDIEEVMEKELMEHYTFDEVDKLKVAHHGSITSSLEEWIDFVDPKEAYMIVSLKNKHGHPSDVVVNRYLSRQIPLYRTDQLGTIEVRYFFSKEWKKTSK